MNISEARNLNIAIKTKTKVATDAAQLRGGCYNKVDFQMCQN